MKRYAVIGLGRFGFHVAKTLYEEGSDVIAIDIDKARVQEIEPYCSQAVVLDGTDKDRLSVLGLETIDAGIISIGTNISSSILICLYLQELGVNRIIAKALDEDHAKILQKVGASDIVHPEKDMAMRVARQLVTPNILDFIPMEQDFTVAQVEAPKDYIGKSLSDLNLRAHFNVYVIAIKEFKPENVILAPPADFRIKQSDLLFLLGKREDIKKIKA